MSVISGIVLDNVRLPGVIVAVSQIRNQQQGKSFRSWGVRRTEQGK